MSSFNLLPASASSFAPSVDLYFFFLVGITVFFTLSIFATIAYFSIKYRRQNKSEVPKPIPGNHYLEFVWIAVPLVINVGLFLWGALLYMHNSTPAQNSKQIFCVGKQWMWKFQHPEGPREINDLHVPLGQPIELLMTSEDVIHSFFVPAFRVKMDVVPGRYTRTWFKATKEGAYHIFCTQYCGTDHAQMIGTIYVMKPEDYARWINDRMNGLPLSNETSTPILSGTPEEQGEALFAKYACNTCHRPDTTVTAPDLTELYGSTVLLTNGKKVKADENYLRTSILDPAKQVTAGYPAVMPSFRGQASEEEIMSLIAYIKSLKKQ